MNRLSIVSVVAALAVLLPSAGRAENSSMMKATAPDRMMPKTQAAKMRECDKLAMAQSIRMEDRARFVENCVGGKARPRR
jgi:hypothetical protein